jgi:hypothetical protein
MTSTHPDKSSEGVQLDDDLGIDLDRERSGTTEVNHRAFINWLDNEGQFAHLESLLNAPT